MHPRIILEFVNLFFAGTLAGAEFITHTAFRAPIESLEEATQIRFRQALTLKLRVIVPALFVPTALSAIAITILNGTAPGIWLRVAGVCAAFIWILTRIIVTIPVNSATLDWQPDAPPTNWRTLINRAERCHIIGVWLAVGMFACFLIAAMLRHSVP